MARLYVICGHGAGDPGAGGFGYEEAERVRALGRRIAELGGSDVVLLDTSRNWYADNGISSLSLPQGSALVELHMDSGAAGARGGHVIIKEGFAPDRYDEALASLMGRVFPGRSSLIVGRSDLANPNRAARRGINYRLVENGFISDRGDLDKFNSRLDEIARGYLAAFGISPGGGSGGGASDYARINKACEFAFDVANDESHGYTQGPGRCGPTDYDCSGLVGKALEVAGYDMKAGPDTASLPAALERAGFRRRDYVPGTLKRGSVEIRPKTAERGGHVAICIDSDKQVITEAYANEFGGATGGKPGDQTGGEIRNVADYGFGTSIYDPPEYFGPAPKPKPTVVPKEGPDEVIDMSARQGDVARLYNPKNGDHVYTTDANEAKALAKGGWKREGVMGVAPRGLADVHRLVNASTGEHILTDDLSEVQSLLKQGENLSDGTKSGWQYEGVAFIAYADDRGAKKIRRMYKKGAFHLLTSDENEVRELVKKGWTDEGVKFSLDA